MKRQNETVHENNKDLKNLREHLKYLRVIIKRNPDDLSHRMDEILNAHKDLVSKLNNIEQEIQNGSRR